MQNESVRGREEEVTVRAAVRDECLLRVGYPKTLGINGHCIEASADRTLNGSRVRVLLHDSSPVRVTQENREMRADA